MGNESDIRSRGRLSPSTRQRFRIDLTSDGADWTALAQRDASGCVAEIARAIPAHVGLPATGAAATVVLSHDAAVRALNKTWRGQDKATNVLSFPATARQQQPTRRLFVGDVIVAEETLVREAGDLGIPIADHFRHLVLHGLLHLLGFDHASESEAASMESLETHVLASLGVADPYADAEPLAAAPQLGGGT